MVRGTWYKLRYLHGVVQGAKSCGQNGAERRSGGGRQPKGARGGIGRDAEVGAYVVAGLLPLYSILDPPSTLHFNVQKVAQV